MTQLGYILDLGTHWLGLSQAKQESFRLKPSQRTLSLTWLDNQVMFFGLRWLDFQAKLYGLTIN
jgi:hypothetical protein